MNSLKSYLIRAVRDWTLDNGFTPYLLVNATMAGVVAPEKFVNRGRIVLNTHPRAVNGFELDKNLLCFAARFAGQGMRVEIPLGAVLAIYAEENGQGITFPEADADRAQVDAPRAADDDAMSSAASKPNLKIVK